MKYNITIPGAMSKYSFKMYLIDVSRNLSDTIFACSKIFCL